MNDTPLLTLDTIASYLRARDVRLDVEEHPDRRFIRMGWTFDMGEAAVLISLQDGTNNTSRLEITCITQKTYADRPAEVVAFLNARNRERAFGRTLDANGNVWLEYLGMYPTLMELPQDTFDTLFGAVLMHFQEDYAALEGPRRTVQA
ncbi:YbjN domain-containing protein [Deinococcus maricopensis]|uniref:YbjN domain-containing protein n=1 Tax=Deinococcus maricopensis (strain DSM 21211 / LMG 22137 / NRRL B-23946 / LB-34) TaxID=709986 RepID=E8U3T9_DEIML|nr:YbjN domain-containing protein [Deinococcus maricopensis]ADV68782.1 hypothetical protein Deima_3154 [Deinococcus maricopensis DSM 21211]